MDGLSAKPRPPVAYLRAAKARHRGCVLFGYFLLHKQEKVTRPPGRRAEKHRDVSRSSRSVKDEKTKRWAKAHPIPCASKRTPRAARAGRRAPNPPSTLVMLPEQNKKEFPMSIWKQTADLDHVNSWNANSLVEHLGMRITDIG